MYKKSKSKRDPTLDFLRGTALIFMVAAHTSYAVPDKFYSPASTVFEFIAQTAPTVFFFAFGLTFDFFRKKNVPNKIEISKRFLYVALAHNLFFKHSLFVADFLWFLWFWQMFLGLIEHYQKIGTRQYIYTVVIVLIVMIVLPYPGLSFTFNQVVESSFPLLPWGVFVLLGVAFSRLPINYSHVYISISLVTLAVFLFWIGSSLEWENLFLVKRPLTLTYFLLAAGCLIGLRFLVQKFVNIYLSIPFIPGLLESISRNLLLATVVHYFPYSALISLSEKLFYSENKEIQFFLDFDFIVLVAFSAISVIATLLILYSLLYLWNKVKDNSLLFDFRQKYDLIAVALLTVSGVLNVVLDLYTSRTLYRFILWIPLVYFALESNERRKAKS
jgi:hypothetical protein